MRPLKIELHRSAALWTGVLALVVGLGLFYALSGPWGAGTDGWVEQWTNLARWQRWQLNMVWPLVLGAGAWQGRRDRRSGTDELLATMPRGVLRRFVPPGAAMAIGVTAAYFVFFAVGAVQVAGNTDFHTLSWLPIFLVGLLSVIAAALLGMGIGRVLPYLLTAPVLAVGSLAALVLVEVVDDRGSVLSGRPANTLALLSPSLESTNEAFTIIAPSVNLLQGVWFLALAGTGVALFVAATGKARIIALVPVLAAAAIVVPLFPDTKDEVFVPDADATAQVCAEGTPRICLTRLHQDRLREIAGPAREALAELAKLPGAPTAIEEDTKSSLSMEARPDRPGVQLINLDDFSLSKGVRVNVLIGPEFQCTVYDRSNESRRTAVAAWFNGGEVKPLWVSSYGPDPRVMAEAKSILDSIRGLPADQQPARVAEVRAQSIRCPV